MIEFLIMYIIYSYIYVLCLMFDDFADGFLRWEEKSDRIYACLCVLFSPIVFTWAIIKFIFD